MRVITSVGDDGNVKTGSRINLSVKHLQDYENEFQAKLDQGLAEADKNKKKFKAGAK
jgi:hypothetical protein